MTYTTRSSSSSIEDIPTSLSEQQQQQQQQPQEKEQKKKKQQIHTAKGLFGDAPLGYLEEVILCFIFWLLSTPVSIMLSSYVATFICLYKGWYVWPTLHLGATMIAVLSPERQSYSKRLCNGWFVKGLIKYFDAELVVEEPFETSRNYMTCQAPHAIIPFATYGGAFFSDLIFPGREGYCLVASALKGCPLLYRFIEALGGRTISKKQIASLASQGHIVNIVIASLAKEGHIVNIVTGGIAESFLIRDGVEQVLVRRGFIREAIINGLDVVPVYHFNHTQIFDYVFPPAVNQRLATFCRRTGLPWAMFWGRLGLTVPFRKQLKSVVGAPIRVIQNANPSIEQVEEIVSLYKEQMTRIYYQYRPEGDTKELLLLDEFPKVFKY